MAVMITKEHVEAAFEELDRRLHVSDPGEDASLEGHQHGVNVYMRSLGVDPGVSGTLVEWATGIATNYADDPSDLDADDPQLAALGVCAHSAFMAGVAATRAADREKS
jgi:hypothetical protein